jgi:hypothetical protein
MVPVDFSKYAEDGLETAAINVLHILELSDSLISY